MPGPLISMIACSVSSLYISFESVTSFHAVSPFGISMRQSGSDAFGLRYRRSFEKVLRCFSDRMMISTAFAALTLFCSAYCLACSRRKAFRCALLFACTCFRLIHACCRRLVSPSICARSIAAWGLVTFGSCISICCRCFLMRCISCPAVTSVGE